MIYNPNLDPINHIINVSIPWDSINQTSNSHNALDSIAHDIQQMKENAPMISEISYHDIHHYVLIYVILGAVSLIGIILAWKRFRRRQLVVAPVPAAAPAAAPTAARERPRATMTSQRDGAPPDSTPTTNDQCESVVNIQDDGAVKCIFPRKYSRSVSPHSRPINFNSKDSS